ncbi:hypothetical protein C5C49_15340 [Rathayibacter sp. AY1E2]|nr:hypothetical protein C5C49_15340 [Rathayibacter sp. AY1E2]
MLPEANEVEQSEDQTGPAGPIEAQVPGVKFLASLMKATLFTDLFVYHATIRFMHPTLQERVEALRVEHGRFYKWCRNSDFIARMILMSGTTIIVGGAAVGTVVKLFYS